MTTTALLTLGPSHQPNGTIRVTVLCAWPSPPADFYFVTDAEGKIYRAHSSQLSDYKKTDV